VIESMRPRFSRAGRGARGISFFSGGSSLRRVVYRDREDAPSIPVSSRAADGAEEQGWYGVLEAGRLDGCDSAAEGTGRARYVCQAVIRVDQHREEVCHLYVDALAGGILVVTQLLQRQYRIITHSPMDVSALYLLLSRQRCCVSTYWRTPLGLVSS